MHRPFRFIVFPDRPEALLVVAPEGAAPTLQAPPLPAPFTKCGVAEALGAAGLAVRVTEEVPGRWIYALRRAQRDEAAERKSILQVRQATAVALAANSPDELVRERGALVRRLTETEARVAALRVAAAAKGSAGARVLERDLADALAAVQVTQAQLGVVKKRQKARNVAASATFERKFIAAARAMLDDDEYQALVDEAHGVGDDADDVDADDQAAE